MCSIIGYCGKVPDLQQVERAFACTKSRGPDDTRFVSCGEGVLGFHRLAIMGLNPLGMQPFTRDGSAVVCNGEIYGFENLRRELEGKYRFDSESDCEVLLPLYFEHGTDMFLMLDAEFACVIYDGRTGEFLADPGSHRHSAAVLRL